MLDCIDGRCQGANADTGTACNVLTGEGCEDTGIEEPAPCEPLTSGESCDGLRDCRRGCDNDITCLNACENAVSSGCLEQLDALATCGSDQNCSTGPYSSCCACEFEAAFPGHPVFSSTPCEECNGYCNGDESCLNDCISDEPACNNCIQNACGGDICTTGLSQCSGT